MWKRRLGCIVSLVSLVVIVACLYKAVEALFVGSVFQALLWFGVAVVGFIFGIDWAALPRYFR